MNRVTRILALSLALASSALAAAPPPPQRGPVTAPIDPELEKFADHNLSVGKFSYRRKAYAGVKDRLLEVVATYDTYTHIDEVYFVLGETYMKTNEPAEARMYFEKLLAERPDSEFAKKTREHLAELGPGPVAPAPPPSSSPVVPGDAPAPAPDRPTPNP